MNVIRGSEAIAAGTITRGTLRQHYTAIFPDIYIPADAPRDIVTMCTAAWLWTKRRGIIAGLTAAALWGAHGIEQTAPIELIAKPRRRRPGVVIRNERIEDDEICTDRWVPVTTPARTALDLARRLPRDDALRHIDAIAADTDLSPAEVTALEKRYRGARGIASAWCATALMDGGSSSPEETKLRLWLIDAGLPKPTTGITISDGRWEAIISMGWPAAKVGVEWAGHRDGRLDQVEVHELLQRLGWVLIHALPAQSRTDVIYRARAALRQRGMRV